MTDWDMDVEWDDRPPTSDERDTLERQGCYFDDEGWAHGDSTYLGQLAPQYGVGDELSDRASRSAVLGTPSLYFVDSAGVGRIKIGRTRDMVARLATLQSCAPAKLWLMVEVYGAGDLETTAHEVFAQERAIGEWFEGSPRLRRFVGVLQDLASVGNLNREAFASELLKVRAGGAS